MYESLDQQIKRPLRAFCPGQQKVIHSQLAPWGSVPCVWTFITSIRETMLRPHTPPRLVALRRARPECSLSDLHSPPAPLVLNSRRISQLGHSLSSNHNCSQANSSSPDCHQPDIVSPATVLRSAIPVLSLPIATPASVAAGSREALSLPLSIYVWNYFPPDASSFAFPKNKGHSSSWAGPQQFG